MTEVISGAQAEFQETPYEDSTWEILGEIEENPQFNPIDLQVISTGEFQLDPMFEDYGGRLDPSMKHRFHLPEGDQNEALSLEEYYKNHIGELEEKHAALVAEAQKVAFEEGKQKGWNDALEEAKQREGLARDSVKLLFEDMVSQIRDALSKLEKNSVEFALAVSRKIVGTAVEVNPEYLVPIVREALSNAGTAVIKKVRVSPEDFEFIEVVGVRKVLDCFDGTWDFEADNTVRSGCIVETSAGEIDYRLDEAWQRVAEDVIRVVR
ncbi:MAG: hypothetical protein KDD62_09480 [Bdellovibrionales bacterium]|nr:hypothetical protein [Bdellovibrionales bacterium]